LVSIADASPPRWRELATAVVIDRELGDADWGVQGRRRCACGTAEI
jgi:hypothetical protein